MTTIFDIKKHKAAHPRLKDDVRDNFHDDWLNES